MNLSVYFTLAASLAAILLLGTAAQPAPKGPIAGSGPVEFDKDKKLWLYLPADYAPKDKRPLIVYMHGRGGDMKTFEDSPALKPFKEMALQRGFVMVCPEYGSDGWMNDSTEKYILASIY